MWAGGFLVRVIHCDVYTIYVQLVFCTGRKIENNYEPQNAQHIRSISFFELHAIPHIIRRREKEKEEEVPHHLNRMWLNSIFYSVSFFPQTIGNVHGYFVYPSAELWSAENNPLKK